MTIYKKLTFYFIILIGLLSERLVSEILKTETLETATRNYKMHESELFHTE